MWWEIGRNEELKKVRKIENAMVQKRDEREREKPRSKCSVMLRTTQPLRFETKE